MILINKLETLLEKNPEYSWSLFHGHNQTTGKIDYECRIWDSHFLNNKRIFCKGIANSLERSIQKALEEIERKTKI